MPITPTQPAAPAPAATAAREAPQSALGRGLRVLQCFSTAEPDLSARDLMARTGLPKPTLFRLMTTLRELGLLRYSERRGKFTLGPGVLALAAPMLSGLTIRHLARPLMQELANHVQGQVSIALGEGGRLYYVELVQGAGSTVFRPEVGTSASLTRSASGRAYLSTLAAAPREALVHQLTEDDPTRYATLMAKLDETAQDLARDGYCRNQGELHRDVLGVAVPARTPAMDEQLFVFGCTVPAFHLTQQPALLSDLGMRLVGLVHHVETAMGTARA